MDAHIQTAICALGKKTLGDRVEGQRAVTSIYILLAASVIKDSLLVGKVLLLIIWTDISHFLHNYCRAK